MTAISETTGPAPGFFAPTPGNWRLALLIAVVLVPGSIWLLPLNVAYWVCLVAVGGGVWQSAWS